MAPWRRDREKFSSACSQLNEFIFGGKGSLWSRALAESGEPARRTDLVRSAESGLSVCSRNRRRLIIQIDGPKRSESAGGSAAKSEGTGVVAADEDECRK